MKIKSYDNLLILSSFIIGAIIRILLINGNSFPLHDGGFFYVLIQDLIENNFKLPVYSTYNDAGIPFLYPPLGLYLVGIVHKITRIALVDIIRVLPVVYSILCLGAFIFFSKTIVKNKKIVTLSIIFFMLLPMEYYWQLLGGGITRGLGSLLSIISLAFLYLFFEKGFLFHGILTGVFCGLTILSHPECAYFTFISAGVFSLFFILKNHKTSLQKIVLVFCVTLLVISPWLVSVINNHGLSFIPQMFGENPYWLSNIADLLLLMWTKEPWFPFINLFALIGVAVSIRAKNLLFPVWVFTVFCLQGRAADQRVVIPLAVLAGIGANFLLETMRWNIQNMRKPLISVIFAELLFLYCLMSGFLGFRSTFKSIPLGFSKGLDSFSEFSNADATFIVITDRDWRLDYYSEWVIALTNRKSVNVVQGYEWLPGFSDRIQIYNQFRKSFNLGYSSFENYKNEHGITIDYLIIPISHNSNDSNNNTDKYHLLSDALLDRSNKIVLKNDDLIIIQYGH